MCLSFILLYVVRAKELLEVKVSDLCITGLKKITKLVVHNKNTTVLGVLETLLGNVLINSLSNLTARDKIVGT
jgi:hypothetical protein